MKAPPDRAVRIESRPWPQLGQSRGVGPVPGRREEMRLEHLVDLVENLGDPKLRSLFDRGGEIAPEPREHIVPVALSRGDVVELLLEVRGELVAHVLAEVVDEKGRHQPAPCPRGKSRFCSLRT